MHILRTVVISFLFSFAIVFNSFSQDNKEYKTSKWGGITPTIDGIFEDAIWQQNSWKSGFTQNSPDNGNSPSQKTAFKLFYDDQYIYVAIKAFDTQPRKIDAQMSRRDAWKGDRLAIELDSYNDNRTGFIFCVSSAGVKNDGVITREDGIPDSTIDPIWYVKTAILDDGWNAEMKIPLSQLKYSSENIQEWGIQIVRFFSRNQEYDTWAHISNEDSGWVNHYAKLIGIENIKPKRQMEIAPFMLLSGDFDKNRSSNPLEKVNEIKVDVGVNGKIGLTNYLTLDYTINPDFGQVEADPAQLNLSEFELFFQERRPFFLEGQNITSFSLSALSRDNLFYSRRIGKAPQAHLNSDLGEYIKRPDRTRILAALKLTGKTKNGWSIGIVESLTNREYATVGNEDSQRKEPIEPYTNYLFTRIEKDLNKGNTVIGGVFSSTNRIMNHSNFNGLVKSAISGGVNVNHYFNKRKHFVGFNFVGSNISGSKEAILNQQLSSRRYFQRPDVDYMQVNPDLTSLSGTSAMFTIGKRTNGGFNYSLLTTWRSPEFEINDLGYLRKANYIVQNLKASYAINKPHFIFRSSRFEIVENTQWDFGGFNNKLSFSHNGNLYFKNLWFLRYSAGIVPVNIRPTSMRGGPALHDVSYSEIDFDLSTNKAKKIDMGIHGWEAFNGSNTGKSWEISARAHYRPINALEIGVAGYYGKFHQDLHYVNTTNINGNNKYIYGAITQKLVNLILKIRYNITPDFTIQYYGAPYVTSGDVNNFKNVNDPDAEAYNNRFHLYDEDEISYNAINNSYDIQESNTGDSFSFGNPNFNFKDFRSNLVLRWEYKPGSSVYLVWSQSKNDFSTNGDLNFGNSIKDLFSSTGRNIIMLKFSYRFQG